MKFKNPWPYGTVLFLKELENCDQITIQLSPRWNKLTEFPMSFRLGRELISHLPFQFRCNLDPVIFVHWSRTSVPCFLLSSSLRKLLFTSFCLTLNIHYLWSFTNGHHNPLHSLLQSFLSVVSVSLTVSGQEGHAWCCACKSNMYACSDRSLLLKGVLSQ